MLPLCYAAYAAVANSAARKSASARLNGSTDVPASIRQGVSRAAVTPHTIEGGWPVSRCGPSFSFSGACAKR